MRTFVIKRDPLAAQGPARSRRRGSAGALGRGALALTVPRRRMRNARREYSSAKKCTRGRAREEVKFEQTRSLHGKHAKLDGVVLFFT